jgi:hypothetical protein
MSNHKKICMMPLRVLSRALGEIVESALGVCSFHATTWICFNQVTYAPFSRDYLYFAHLGTIVLMNAL